jgi:hypothetical protein
MALVLAAASVMAGLGQWQLDWARENNDEQQQKQQKQQEQACSVTALDGVLRARQTFPGPPPAGRSEPRPGLSAGRRRSRRQRPRR